MCVHVYLFIYFCRGLQAMHRGGVMSHCAVNPTQQTSELAGWLHPTGRRSFEWLLYSYWTGI